MHDTYARKLIMTSSLNLINLILTGLWIGLTLCSLNFWFIMNLTTTIPNLRPTRPTKPQIIRLKFLNFFQINNLAQGKALLSIRSRCVLNQAIAQIHRVYCIHLSY